MKINGFTDAEKTNPIKPNFYTNMHKTKPIQTQFLYQICKTKPNKPNFYTKKSAKLVAKSVYSRWNVECWNEVEIRHLCGGPQAENSLRQGIIILALSPEIQAFVAAARLLTKKVKPALMAS